MDKLDVDAYEVCLCIYTNTRYSGAYLVSDILITDYSSVMFDYSMLKTIIFYA